MQITVYVHNAEPVVFSLFIMFCTLCPPRPLPIPWNQRQQILLHYDAKNRSMKNQKLAAETFFTPNLAAAHILCRGRENQQKLCRGRENQQKLCRGRDFALHGCVPRRRNTGILCQGREKQQKLCRGRDLHYMIYVPRQRLTVHDLHYLFDQIRKSNKNLTRST
jgi:nitric oxide reductase activation protein